MNCKLVAVFAVLFSVMLSETDALRLRIRGRRVLRRLKGPLCKVACSYACTTVTSGTGTAACAPVCHNVCRRVRRSAKEVNRNCTWPSVKCIGLQYTYVYLFIDKRPYQSKLLHEIPIIFHVCLGYISLYFRLLYTFTTPTLAAV